jgi:hypothetical protein
MSKSMTIETADAKPGSAPLGGAAARTPEDEARIELYNAATEYGQMINSTKHDLDEVMRIAQRLEDAAEAFVEKHGYTEKR